MLLAFLNERGDFERHCSASEGLLQHFGSFGDSRSLRLYLLAFPLAPFGTRRRWVGLT
jgi:hypothetical protein